MTKSRGLKQHHHECLRCDRKWVSVSEFPEQCPGCGTFSFDVPCMEATEVVDDPV